MHALASRPGRSRFAACVRRFATSGCVCGGLLGWASAVVWPRCWPTVARVLANCLSAHRETFPRSGVSVERSRPGYVSEVMTADSAGEPREKCFPVCPRWPAPRTKRWNWLSPQKVRNLPFHREGGTGGFLVSQGGAWCIAPGEVWRVRTSRTNLDSPGWAVTGDGPLADGLGSAGSHRRADRLARDS